MSLAPVSDALLLDTYYEGFKACAKNERLRYTNLLMNKAFDLGWDDYLIGDDVPSHDYQPEEEILKRIKS